MISTVIFSRKTDEWATPRALFRALDVEYGPFDLDPCATRDTAKCARFFSTADDGLSQSWTGRVFMNPPYSDIGAWMRKAREESRRGAAIVVCLVPSRTDTAWWHVEVEGRADVRFLRGRVKFHPMKNSAPFPSALVVYRALATEGGSAPDAPSKKDAIAPRATTDTEQRRGHAMTPGASPDERSEDAALTSPGGRADAEQYRLEATQIAWAYSYVLNGTECVQLTNEIAAAMARVDAETREAMASEMAALRAERDALAEFWAGACELTMDADGGRPGRGHTAGLRRRLRVGRVRALRSRDATARTSASGPTKAPRSASRRSSARD